MIGASKFTQIKQQHFQAILRIHMMIVRSIMKKWYYVNKKYLYADLYSGCGGYFFEGKWIVGSPVIATNSAGKIGIDMDCHLNDEDAKNISCLKEYVFDPISPKFSVSKSSVCLSNMQDLARKNQYGLIYLDPNGHPEFDGVKAFFSAKNNSKVDVLINCNATVGKRLTSSTAHAMYTNRLVDNMLSIDKKYWLIKEPYKGDSWQFTFVLGTNWSAFPEFKDIGMYSVTSTRGLELLKLFSYSEKERKRLCHEGWYRNYDEYLAHPIYKIIKREVLADNKFKCSQCDTTDGTYCHHTEYPDWGTFDVFDGKVKNVKKTLLPVCQSCHAEIEQKEI